MHNSICESLLLNLSRLICDLCGVCLHIIFKIKLFTLIFLISNIKIMILNYLN